jgi:dynein heavy chain 2
LRGLLQEAIYGGRVDVASDLSILSCYIKKFFNEDILNGKDRLMAGMSSSRGLTYPALTSMILELPEQDQPQDIGLPSSADKAVQRLASERLLRMLRSLSLPSTSELRFSKASWAPLLNPLLNRWKKLAESIPRHKLEES